MRFNDNVSALRTYYRMCLSVSLRWFQLLALKLSRGCQPDAFFSRVIPMYANFAIKMFSHRKDGPLKRLPQLLSRYRLKMRRQRDGDSNANCAPLHYAHLRSLGMRFSCTLAENKFCGRRFLGQTAAAFVLFARRKCTFLLKGMHSPQLS